MMYEFLYMAVLFFFTATIIVLGAISLVCVIVYSVRMMRDDIRNSG
jgi:hypothetical protein